MQNIHEIKINVELNETQVELLTKRYFLNLAWTDRMAEAYQHLSLMHKTILYFALTTGLVASLISLNLMMVALFSLALLWLSILKQHYQALQERLDVLLKDITLSEQQLKQAVTENLKLQAKLEEALKENTKVVQHLMETRQEIEQISEQAKIKDLEIEEARQQLVTSSEKITALTADLMTQKKLFSEKMAGFFLFLEQRTLMIEQGGATTCTQGQQAHPS